MILISHRGNISGPEPTRENNPTFIERACDLGFDCEIDVWLVNDKLYLGHDEPTYEIDQSFLDNEKLWCHAKNFESLVFLRDNNYHCFWHENDLVALTSNGYIWTHTNTDYTKMVPHLSIAVMPEWDPEKRYINRCVGICSDFISNYTE